MSSRGWMDPRFRPNLHLKLWKCRDRTSDLVICSQTRRPLDQRGSIIIIIIIIVIIIAEWAYANVVKYIYLIKFTYPVTVEQPSPFIIT